MDRAKLIRVLASQAGAYTLLHASLLISPSVLSHSRLRIIFLTLIWACHIQSFKDGIGYLAIAHGLWATELLLFRNPREDFRLIRPKRTMVKSKAVPTYAAKQKTEDIDENEVVKQAYPESLWERFWWVTKLVVSLRYVGWDVGDGRKPNFIPKPYPPLSRSEWLVRKLLILGIWFVIWDATNFYRQFDPYFQASMSIDSPLSKRFILPKVLEEYHVGFLLPRLLRIANYGVQQYAYFSMWDAVFAILFVTLGFLAVLDDSWTAPEYWRPMMGSPLLVTRSGLRGFWGGFWYQTFRNILSSPGTKVSHVLGLPDASPIAHGIRVILAFAISAGLNYTSLPLDDKETKPLNLLYFFSINGACVIFENIASSLATKVLGPEWRLGWMRHFLRAVRFIWTATVLYRAVPLIEDEAVKISRRFVHNTPQYIFKTPQT